MNVLMYHFVNSTLDSKLFSGMHGISVEDFEAQLSLLIKNGTPLSEKDIRLAALSGNYPNDECFYLTFDDGFKQHFNNVYPILKDYGLQASFFVPTMALESKKTPIVEKQRLLQYNLFINYEEFLGIFCKLIRSVYKSKDKSFLYPNFENISNSQNYLKEYTFYSNEERYFRMIRNEYLTTKEFESIINNMFSKFYSNDKQFIDEYYMSISDLKKMNSNGMLIGGHSYSHPFLNKMPFEEIKKEVDKSMIFLRNKVDSEINSFAYPFGAFNDNVVECMKQSEIDYAFDTRTEGESSRYNIRRNDAASFLQANKIK